MNIYVGNLHYDINEDILKSVFEEYGEVSSAKIIIDKYSGKSKGFGFIEMPNDSEGRNAVESLNGKEVKGRNLKVNEAREKSETNFKKPPRSKSFNR
jgi:RNA recognition motif-containing protein